MVLRPIMELTGSPVEKERREMAQSPGILSVVEVDEIVQVAAVLSPESPDKRCSRRSLEFVSPKFPSKKVKL